MNVETSVALEKSIKHWGRVETGNDTGTGISACALCGLFFDNKCIGCPVMSRTGKAVCFDSPYEEYSRNPTPENARKMRDFLVSLREKPKQKEVTSTVKIKVIHEEPKPMPVPVIKEVVLTLSRYSAKKLRESLGPLCTSGDVFRVLFDLDL